MKRSAVGKRFSTAHLTARRLPPPPLPPRTPLTATATDVIALETPPSTRASPNFYLFFEFTLHFNLYNLIGSSSFLALRGVDD